jgi:perosamine synthetase
VLGADPRKKSAPDECGAARPMIPIARPWMDEREAEAARRVILSGWVTQGPEVAAFESEFASFVGSTHACAVSSGTAGLHLALLALGITPGSEIVTVSHSFIATANSIRLCGATPVFVDIEPGTFNLDPTLIERTITPRTRAILCVHQLGMPCDLAAVLEVGRRRGVPVIEDAACAAGSEILWNDRWERIGGPRGDIACFSFHPRKLLSTGDGGMLTTANPDWDQQFRLWRHQGMSVPDTIRHRSREVIDETYPVLGYNYRLTDIQAAVGREQLRKLPEAVARRRVLAERYHALLRDVPGCVPPQEPPWARSNWQSYCARLPATADQHAVMQRMLDAGIATRRGVMCAHREVAYQGESWSCGAGPGGCGCPARTCARLPQSEIAQDRALILPLYADMTEAEQRRVVAALREACSA